MTVLTTHEQQEIDRANTEGKQPVVFVHGLWLLASSWDRWRALFEEQGYTTLAPGWPDDPETVEEAHDDPEVFAHKRLKQVTDHYIDAIRQLKRKPAVIGHSFGGLIAQMVAGEGVAAVTVAIDPAQFRGVLPLPLSAIKSSSAVLGNPLNYSRAVPLTYEQFRYAFANAVDENEAHSTPGRKTRSTPRTPSVAHSCSLRASKTIRSRWRSSRLLTSCSNTIPRSPSSAQSPIEDIPWSLTMGGVM